MYTIADYGEMIADRARTDAYAQALRRTVKPGAVVADIGSGTGILALLACQFGAGRVYAIEAGDALPLAREIAAANGFDARIEFLAGLSTELMLPEQADVIVSDLRGTLPLFERHIVAIADARRRFLKPGGVMVPRRDILWAAPVEAAQVYSRITSGWSENGYGLDMTAARRAVTNTIRKARVKREELLAEPQHWVTLDYAAVEDPNVSAQLTWRVARPGTGHGLCAWFDSELAEGVSVSNCPGAPEMIYGQMFFPWSEPVKLASSDVVTAGLHAHLTGEDYVWRWETCIRRADAREAVARFKQSTFFGAPLSAAKLRKRAASYVPALDEKGEIHRFILTLMDGHTALDEIARRTAERFPGRFARWEDALTRVGELSEKYGR